MKRRKEEFSNKIFKGQSLKFQKKIVDNPYYTKLHYAVLNKQFADLVDLLNTNKADIDVRDSDWYYTAAHWAIHIDDEKAFNILIKYKANIKYQTMMEIRL